MLARDYLNLALVRLPAGRDWSAPAGCLSFVFPIEGAGYLRAPAPAPKNGANGRTRPAHGVKHHPGPLHTDLARGDVLVLNGGPQHLLRRGPFAFWTFSLCLEHLFPLFAGRDLALLDTLTERFRAPRLYPAASPVARECHRLLADVPPQFDIDHRSQLLRAASAVLAAEFKHARAAHSGFRRVEERFRHTLESLSVTQLLEKPVEDLAAKFGVTTRQLNRVFHRYFGMSAAAFKMEMRLLRAASLLCDPAAKVIHVAGQCGFNFLGQFNTCFKRRFGASPGQWRQNFSGAHAPAAPPAAAEPACRMNQLGLCPWPETRRKRDEKLKREEG